MIKIDGFEVYRVKHIPQKKFSGYIAVIDVKDLEYTGKRKTDMFLFRIPGEKELRHFPRVSEVIINHPEIQWFNLEVLPEVASQYGMKGRIFTFEFSTQDCSVILIEGETPEV